MLKKNLALFICAIAVVSMIGCGNKQEVPENTTSSEKYEKAVDVLALAGSSFDDEMINYFGGMNAEGEIVNGVPCEVSLDDAEAVGTMLTFPADSISLVDEAASLTHLMNANTYTSAAFHVKNPEDLTLLAESIKDTVMSNQWICGFPEKLVIGQVENYIVYAYGRNDLVDIFQQGLVGIGEDVTVHFVEDLTVIEDELPPELLNDDVVVEEIQSTEKNYED